MTWNQARSFILEDYLMACLVNNITIKKKTALWIGVNRRNKGRSISGRNFIWPKYKVDALGPQLI